MPLSELHLQPHFITDAEGQRIGVILAMDVYLKVLEALEDPLDQTDFDEAVASASQVVPFDQAVAEIEAKQRAA